MKALLLLLGLAAAAGTACGGGGNKDTPDAGPPADTQTVPDASCFMNPTTHKEIINACTDAQKIERNVTPPLLNPDGSLPPLP